MIQDVIVELVLGKFNLCFCELVQFTEKVPEDRARFLRKMLKQIRDGKVQSPHMDSEHARSAIKMLDLLMVQYKEETDGEDKTTDNPL